MLYQICATVTRCKGNHSITKQIPTFYLNSNVQGIVSAEHAKKIAKDIINVWDGPNIEINVTVTPLKEKQNGVERTEED